MSMSRSQALILLKQYLKNEKLIKHCIAVEAIMRNLAKALGEDEELWALTGLLHDIDYELAKGDMEKHGVISTENILRNKLPKEALEAIRAHNELTGFVSDTKLALALKAADQASGLIVATALVMPNKRLSEVKLSSLLKKFKQKDFARSVRRDKIRLCERIGLPLERFLEISLKALQEVHEELGL